MDLGPDAWRGPRFYTAWGHDDRTWSHPGFHNLVERGIRWAVKDDPAKAGPYHDRPEMTPLDPTAKPFETMAGRLPNYPAGEKWGTNGEPINTMQKPLDPAESQKHMSTPVGFRPELFAAEPAIGKPLALNWDERGRLWIVETVDYPNELQPPGAGRDRIRICEDTDRMAGGQVHDLCRQAEYPDEPHLCVRRRRHSSGAGHAVSPGHDRRRRRR